MNATELSFGIAFLLQIGIGISVNLFLFLFYSRTVTASRKVSPSDLILIHLAFSNAVILLTFGLPETLSAWGLRNFLSDGGCKILMYVFRVARGLSICSTCLLSVFQAVTISPGTSRWARIKARLPGCILPSCLLSWGLSLLVDLDAPFNITGPRNSSVVRIMLDLKYCSKVSESAETTLLIAVVFSLRDLFFVGLMSLASGYMVFVLHRHHRQVRHLHGPGRSPGETPEVRAAKRVVALVTLYVLLYGRQSIMLSVFLNRKEKSPLLMSSHLVFSIAFSSVSPLLMLHSDRRIRTIWKRESVGSRVNSS
ncbi:vomeronasal 1 receptor ornAnaV1R3223 [Ornithorhynchus anatinus]|uniref:vomeronasal 1 receptor ornAnaV1R3223 n=1 Tax=Ornithorhynchus anatinus TaxID=9258 RepID=UPI00130E93BE|nr:vomeronasal 1 receptor ornAnaV1R3223 [Ornithorhynchus anatinus]